ncbi:hypothetical protein ABT093_24370 [Kitasatospora sp. NPDC002551]
MNTFIRRVSPQPAATPGQAWVRPVADHPGSAERHRGALDRAAAA